MISENTRIDFYAWKNKIKDKILENNIWVTFQTIYVKENETKKKISSNDPRTAKIAFYKHFTQDLHRNPMYGENEQFHFKKSKINFQALNEKTGTTDFFKIVWNHFSNDLGQKKMKNKKNFSKEVWTFRFLIWRLIYTGFTQGANFTWFYTHYKTPFEKFFLFFYFFWPKSF